jgi:hypothetical protein
LIALAPEASAVKSAPAVEAASVSATVEPAAPISAVPTAVSAVIIPGAPIDAAPVAIPPIVTATAAIVTADAVEGSAVVRRAVIAAGVDRRDITRVGIDASLITTGKRDRKRCDDRAQKNSTANHELFSLA